METVTADVNATESSTVESAIPESGPAYEQWRLTGKSEPPKKEAAAASQETSAEGEQPEEKTAPAPEAGKKQEKHKATAEIRLQELLSDLKTAGLSPSELKTFRREASQRQEAAPKVEAPKAEQPKPKSDAPARPVFGDKDGETWAEFQARDTEWVASMVEHAVGKERQRLAEETQQQKLMSEVEKAEDRYGADARATIGSAIDSVYTADIPGAVKAVINDSPVLVDLAYVMGSKPEDLEKFLALAKRNPSQAIRQVVLMERLVQEELSKPVAGRDETGKFAKPPEPKTTKAPPIGTEVSGRSAAPEDEEAKATRTENFDSFRNSRNRADIERLRGR